MFSYFRNCSLFNQLIIPMVVVGVIGASAIIASAFVLNHSVKELSALDSASGERLRTLQDIDKGIANIRALSLKHLANESAQGMKQIGADLAQTERRLKSYLPSLSDLNTHAQDTHEHRAQHQSGVTLSQAIGAYLAGIDEALALSSEFEKEAAFELLSRLENKQLANIQPAMQALTRHTIEDIATSRQDLITATNRNLKINFAVDILGGALLLGMAFYVSRRTSVRVADLLKWSQRIAEGDLSNPLVSNSADEVGQLTNAMRGMVENVARGRNELVTARKDAEKVAEELRLYANAFDSSGEAMLITDRFNRIVNVNATFTEQTGYTLEEVQGKDPKLLSSGKTADAVYADMWHSLQDSGYWNGELWDRKKTGEVYPKGASISTIRDASQAVAFYIAS